MSTADSTVPRALRRLAFGTGGLLLGLSVGLGAVVWHSYWWGLLLGFLATAATTSVLPAWARLGFLVGWWVPVARGVVPTGAGDLLVQGDWHGYALLIGGFVVSLAVMLRGASTRPPAAREAQDPPPTS